MKKILTLSLICLIGCNPLKKAVCDLETKAVGSVTAVVSTALTCKNSSAIEADVAKLVGGLGVCTQGTSKIIGVCSIIAEGVLNIVVANGIPKAWGCTGSAAKEILKPGIENACHAVGL